MYRTICHAEIGAGWVLTAKSIPFVLIVTAVIVEVPHPGTRATEGIPYVTPSVRISSPNPDPPCRNSVSPVLGSAFSEDERKGSAIGNVRHPHKRDGPITAS